MTRREVEALAWFFRSFPDRSGYEQTGRRLHRSKSETIDSIMTILIRDAEGGRPAAEHEEGAEAA